MFGKFRFNDDDKGQSLVELVIAMALLAISLPFVSNVGVTSLKTGNIATTASLNTLSASTINTTLTEDIRGASAVNIASETQIQFKSQNDVCTTWKIDNNKLLRSKDESKIDSSSEWATISDRVKTPTNNSFSLDAGGSVSYNFLLGDDNAVMKVEGKAQQEIVDSGQGECW